MCCIQSFYDVEAKAKAGNKHAQAVIASWAEAEWFLSKPAVAEKITVTVFKVTGETNIDDLTLTLTLTLTPTDR